MIAVNALKRQHRQIADAIREVEGITTPEMAAEKSTDIAMTIGSLSGVLLVHLASEDKCLYPVLSNSPDVTIQMMGQRFTQEMGQLREAFIAYRNQYTLGKNIKANPTQFISDTKRIAEAIKTRVAREDSELYPLLV